MMRRIVRQEARSLKYIKKSTIATGWFVEKSEETKKVLQEYGMCVSRKLLSDESTVALEKNLLYPALKILKKMPIAGIGIGSRLGFFEVVQRSPGRYDIPIALNKLPKREAEILKNAAEEAAGGESLELAFCGVVIAKPGSSAQEWHIDSLHEKKTIDPKPLVINILIPLLSDVTLEMGPTELIPGSHKHSNHLISNNFGSEIAYQDRRNTPELLGLDPKTKVIIATNSWQRGDALLFDDRILHRGGANVSNTDRCIAYASYRRRDAKASTHFEAFRSLPKFCQQAATVAHAVRSQFAGLSSRSSQIICDGAGGSQVPFNVVNAVTRTMLYSAANVGGLYSASDSATRTVQIAREKFASFFKYAGGPDEIIFGANATTLNAHLGHALFRSFLTKKKTNIVLSAMEHDSNAGLWAQFAHRFDLQVRILPLSKYDKASLDISQCSHLIDSGTAFVAVGLASNGLGSVQDVATVCNFAKEHTAYCFVDAVHAAPHIRLDLKQLGWPDFVVCSPYKFFGPHLGVLYASRDALSTLEPDKLPIADNRLPSIQNCFMSPFETGTQQFENIAGASAALDYLASVGQRFGGIDSMPSSLYSLTAEQEIKPSVHLDLSTLLDAAFFVIAHQETLIKQRFLQGIADISPKLRVLGHQQWDQRRTSTFAIDIEGMPHELLTETLVKKHGVICTSGNHYCTFWQDTFGIPGATRLSFLHYNTLEDVDSALSALESIIQSSSS